MEKNYGRNIKYILSYANEEKDKKIFLSLHLFMLLLKDSIDTLYHNKSYAIAIFNTHVAVGVFIIRIIYVDLTSPLRPVKILKI